MRLVIFGPQGAGKGTQAARISEKYGIPSIATGDVFRSAMAAGSELGTRAREFVDSGQLVPDDLTIAVVRERLMQPDCRDGFLLDGFPRNVKQAEALDNILRRKGTQLNAALVIEVPQEVSLRRITGRRVCLNCGANYHLDAPPKRDWICDRCGAEVTGRTDDADEETISRRLTLYYRQTEPLKEYYAARGLLRTINGDTGGPDDVFASIVAAL